MDFAVHIEDLHEEGQGSWVLAVDRDKVLIAHDFNGDDQTMRWYPLSECAVLKVGHPEVPRPVYMVQPASKKVLLPGDNRMARRRNGG